MSSAHAPTMPLLATKLRMTSREVLAKPFVHRWEYWLMSFLRWCLDAKGHGALKLLMRRPYLAKVSSHRSWVFER